GATFGASGTVEEGTLTINGRAIAVAEDSALADIVNAINDQTSRTGVTAAIDGGQLQLTNETGADIAIGGTSSSFLDGIGLAAAGNITGSGSTRTIGGGTEADPGVGGRNTLDGLVKAINDTYGTAVRASNDNGKLRIE